MDNFADLRELIASTKVDNKTYVYFDQETGKIERVGAKTDSDDLSYITVDPKTVEPLMKGEKGLNSYIVEYDIVSKKLNLKELKKPVAEDERSLLTFKEIPVIQKTKKIDVLVQQDFKNCVWKIFLSDKISESLKQEAVYIRSSLFFSITQKNNPNILYRTINCSIAELVENEFVEFPFESQFEIDKVNLSVYTSTYFDVYKYEVLDEEI